MDICVEKMDKVRRRDSYVYGMDDLVDNVKYLVTQYIYQNSEYSVNISSFTRMGILNKFNDFSKSRKDSISSSVRENIVSELITIFHEALQQTISLLKTDSFARFYRTNEYKLMISEA